MTTAGSVRPAELPSLEGMDSPTLRSGTDPSPTPSPAARTTATPRLPVWLRVLLPMILFLPIASSGALLLLIPGFGDLMNRPDAAGAVAYVPFAGLTMAAYLLVSWALLRWVDRRPVRELGLRPDARALLALLLGCALALVLMLLAAGAVGVLGPSPPVAATTGLEQSTAMSLPIVVMTILLVVVRGFVLQGIGEEVLFRGYLLQSLRHRPVLAVLLTAIAFTLPHLASGGGQQNALEHVLYLAMPLGFAISAGFLAIALRSVWAAIGIHGGFHLANFVAVALETSVDGPAMWIALGAMHLLAGIAIALATPRRRWAEVRAKGPYARRQR